MKIILCDNSLHSFELIADSALTLPGRPTFIPDFKEVTTWKAIPLIAVRISRLGKTISAKFASRYFDACTLAARIMPYDSQGHPMDGIAAILDFGITLGEWAPVPDCESLRITFAGEETVLPSLCALFTDATVAVSRYATLKMGDILLIPLPLPSVEAIPDVNVNGTMDSAPLLNMRMK